MTCDRRSSTGLAGPESVDADLEPNRERLQKNLTV